MINEILMCTLLNETTPTTIFYKSVLLKLPNHQKFLLFSFYGFPSPHLAYPDSLMGILILLYLTIHWL